MKSRRFSRAIAFTLALPFIFVFGLAPLTKISTAAPTPVDKAPFKGKLVMVVFASKHSLLLENAEVRKLEDRSFVVGKGSNEGGPTNWTKGQLIWFPMSRVEMIVEFENVEAMKKAWEEYEKNNPAPPDNIH